VVVYRNAEGFLLAHRLLGYYRRRGRWHLLIRADNARTPDPAVVADQVVGRATNISITLSQRLRAVGRYIGYACARLGLPRMYR
jgi:hypothetical protein